MLEIKGTNHGIQRICSHFSAIEIGLHSEQHIECVIFLIQE